MDYGKILTRAWEITWRWKILWILGFLAALGQGGGGGNFNWNLGSGGGAGGPSGDWGEWGNWGGWSPDEAMGAILAIAGVLCCLGLLITVAVFVVSTIARGGLIAGVREVEDEGSTTFRSAWRGGVRRFWTLAGIWLLAFIPAILGVLIAIGLAVAAISGGVLGSEVSEPAAAFGVLGPLLACGIPLCCGLIILTFVLSFVQIYADRAAVLDGLSWIDAIRYGWQMFKRNLGPTLIFWLVTLVIGLIVGILAFGVVAVVALPAAGIFMGTKGSAWALIPICGGGLLAAIVLMLVSAIVNTFTSAMWTLVYRSLPQGTVPVVAPAE